MMITTLQLFTLPAFLARFARLCILLAVLLSQNVLAQMTDIIHFENGDRMTGAISEMNLGEMRFESRSMGFVNIKWEDVAGIETNKTIQFETSLGTRHFGTVSQTENGDLAIRTRNGEKILGMDEVVYFQRIKADRSVWEAMDKDLRLGFSFSRGSEVLRWNVGAGLALMAFSVNRSHGDCPGRHNNCADLYRAVLSI